MADITFDNAISSTIATASFTMSATQHGLLIVAAYSELGNSMTATFNGVSMTSITSGHPNNTYNLFYLVAPTSGTHTISVSGASCFAAHSFVNAQQAGIPDSLTTANATSLTVNPVKTNTIIYGVGFSWQSGQGGSLTAPTLNPKGIATGSNDGQSANSALQATNAGFTVSSTGFGAGGSTLIGLSLAGDSSVTPSPLVVASDSTAVTDTIIKQISFLFSKQESTVVSDTPIIFLPFPRPSINDSTAVSDTPKVEIISTISVSDTTSVSDTPSFREPSFSPIITIRDAISPYDVLASAMYVQSTLGGNNLPVLQGENSNPFLFRIYNNYARANNIAAAVNVRITTFDGVDPSSHTTTQSVVNQEWLRVYESGFGENSTPPGLYTRYTGQDTAIGGNDKYAPEFGSDGTANSQIRAGTDGNGVGFIEITSYTELPDTVGMYTYIFGISIMYDWVS